MTKKQNKMYSAIINSDYIFLDDVYSSFSKEKENAYKDCVNDMEHLRGFNFRITSFNSFLFSCGFFYRDDESVLHCRYYTGKNIYDFFIE